MSLEELKFNNPQYDVDETWTASSFTGMGNYGKADIPNLDATQMQKVMDQLPRYIASVVNDIIDQLASEADGTSGADQIGATAVGSGTATTVQGILEELAAGGGGGSAKLLSGSARPTAGQGTDGDVYVQYAASPTT